MSLDKLVEQYYRLDKDINLAIQESHSFDVIKTIDERMVDLSHKISEHKPRDLDELKNKLSFFVSQALPKHEMDNGSSAISAIVNILENDFSFSMHNIMPLGGAGNEDASSFKQVNAYDLVSTSHDRISIVDSNFRYVNTSQRNGEFYQFKPHEIIGKHVGDMIGENRFEGRAKGFFEKSFSGKKQEYFHSLETERGARIMSCQMMPLRGRENNVYGSMVAMSDITNLITSKDSVILQQVNAAIQ